MKSTGPSPKFVFVCYSRADMEVVDRVLVELEKGGHRMWIDRAGIVGSQTWRAKIVEAMQQCGAVLFFGSRSSYASRHVATELTLAEEARKPIVPVLLDDSPPDGDMRYFLARLHHLNLCGNDESCAIQVIHDTLLRIGEPSGFSDSALPLRSRRRPARALITFLALTVVAAAAWILWKYSSNPKDANLLTMNTAENLDIGTKHENTPDAFRKPQIEPKEASKDEFTKEQQRELNEKHQGSPPQKGPTDSGDRPEPSPVVLLRSDPDWMVPGTEALVIQAIQRGILTSESGDALPLSVDYDIGQTVRILKKSRERVQIGSSLPGMGNGWLKKEDANQYLKRKP